MSNHCPNQLELEQLLLGVCPEGQSQRLEKHLSSCASCGESVQQLVAEDDLVVALKKSPVARQPSGKLDALLDRLCHGMPPGASDTFTTDGGDTPPGPSVRGRVLKCLDPPEVTGDLGQLGRYRVLSVLGAGGMGIVFEAVDPQLQRRVALKIMSPALADDDLARERFLREARAAAALDHDHIVTIYEVDTKGDVPYLAQQLLSGETLSSRLSREGRLSVDEAVRIARETSAALEAAHHRGLIHRDIKPGNIWLEAGTGRVKLLDFGLARATDGDSKITTSGQITGTPAYMAPEQADGREADHRADLFSLGCVLYEMITGTSAFHREGVLATLSAVANYSPPPLQRMCAETSAELSHLVSGLLHKDPRRRPQSADEVSRALDEVPQASGSSARRKSPLAVYAVGIVVGLLTMAVGAYVIHLTTNFGTLVVELHDTDVQMLVDGDRMELKSSGNKVEVRLRPGKHDLQVTKDGFVMFAHRIEIHRGDQTELSVRLKPNELPVFKGHTAGVHAVAFSRQSDLALSGSSDHTVRLWNVKTGEEIRQLKGHESPVVAVAIAPDSKTAASGDASGVAIVWDVQSGQPRHRITEPHAKDSPVASVAFSPDGQQLATSDYDGKVLLWDTASGELKRSYLGHTTRVRRVRFSADGSTLITAGNDAVALVHDIEKGLRRVLQGHAHVLSDADLSADRRFAVTCGWDKTVRLWEVATERELLAIEKHDDVVRSVRFLPGERLAISAGHDATVRVWRLSDGEQLHQMTGHTASVESMDISRDGRFAITASLDHTLRLWRIPTTAHDAQDVKLPTAIAPPESVADVATSRQLRRFEGHTAQVTCVAFSSDGMMAFSGSEDGTVSCWDVRSGQRLRQFSEHKDHVLHLAVRPDGKQVASSSKDGTILLWDPSDCQLIKRLVGHTNWAKEVDYSQDGKQLYSAGYDQTLRRWDLETFKEVDPLFKFGTWVRSVAALSREHRMLAVSSIGVPALYKADTIERLLVLGEKRHIIAALQATPDERFAVAGGWNDALRVYDMRDGRELHWGTGHTSAILSVAVTPDSRRALTGSFDQTLWLWDIPSGKPLRRFIGHTGSVRGVAISRDGKFALSGGDDGSVRLWSLDAENES